MREPTTFPEGTPLPRRAVEQIAAGAHDAHESNPPDVWAAGSGDHDLTRPVDRLDDPDDIVMTTPIQRVEAAEIGTRTLMGVVPRAVRVTAKSGWVEARPASEPAKPHASPAAHQVPDRISMRAGEIAHQPFRADQRLELMHARADNLPRVITAQIPAEPAEHWADWSQLIPTQSPRTNRADKVLAKGYRVLGFAALSAIVLVLAGYIATTAFYFFSTSWIAPAVIAQTDDKVVALKAELATQEGHRARLAAELAELDRSIRLLAPVADRRDELEKAVLARKAALAALARQDEIVRGIQQSAFLRATSEKPTTALVPYENLKGVKAGSAVYGCSYQMVWCRQVGTVVEVLPGEVTFKHPKRDATMRGQLIQLHLMVPEAASSPLLYLHGAPFWL